MKKTTIKKSEVTKGFYKIYFYAESMLAKLPEKIEVQEGELIIKSLKDLGFTGYTKTKDFLNNEFLATKGLELCEPLSAIAYLKENITLGNYTRIAMEPITDSDGFPGIFSVGRYDDGLWLGSYWARPYHEWDPDREFVFRLTRDDSLSPEPSDSLKLSSLTLESDLKNMKKVDLDLEPGFNVTAEYRLGEIRGYNQALDDIKMILLRK